MSGFAEAIKRSRSRQRVARQRVAELRAMASDLDRQAAELRDLANEIERRADALHGGLHSSKQSSD